MNIKERIAELEDKARGYNIDGSFGSEVMETATEALQIIEELQGEIEDLSSRCKCASRY